MGKAGRLAKCIAEQGRTVVGHVGRVAYLENQTLAAAVENEIAETLLQAAHKVGDTSHEHLVERHMVVVAADAAEGIEDFQPGDTGSSE